MATEQFHHTTASGDKITLPKFKNIKAGLVRKLRDKGEAGFIFGILEGIADEGTLAALDELDMDEFGELATAWQKDSGVKPGESSASSNS